MDLVAELVQSRPDMRGLRPAGLVPTFQINDFIHCIPAISNVYLIKTREGDIQINAGMGFEAPAIREQLSRLRSGPLPYLILTQAHVDHVGGVAQLRAPETKVVAQKSNLDCQADDARILPVRNRQSAAWFPRPNVANEEMQAASSFRVQDAPTPDITYEDRLDIGLGGLEVQLLSVPGGETRDSTAIWLPQHKIVFTGNQFGPLFPHFPNLGTIRGDRYRFAETYLDSLRRIRALDAEILVTGHFEPIVGKALIRQCLDRLHDAVEYVHRETLKGMNDGKDIFALMNEVQLPGELYVGQGHGKVSFVVRTIWEQYMGWFRADYTSELYATRPHDVYGDLVQLASLDAVVARGREKLKAGDVEGAGLLGEVALTAAPDNAGAIQLSLDAHRALLDRSGSVNFWEVGWLRYQIGKLEQAHGAAPK